MMPNSHNGDSDASVVKQPAAMTTMPAKAASNHKKKCSNSSNGFGSGQQLTEFEDMVSLMHGSDPVRVELHRLENQVRDKERELGEAQAEIKGLRQSDRLKEKAVEELTDRLNKLDDKLKTNEALLETKNLEIKKLTSEKKEALAAQFAAEASLRRVHAAQKDDDMPPIEAILAPLEAELKLAKQQILKLQEDNKALDRLTKSKEAALLEAEKTVQVALAKASLVDDVQNKNQELVKQVEICQEENKILDKMQRQKVAEVEKLTQTVRELEEAVLSGGAAANAVRDYQRRVQEMTEEMKILERELARAKVNANRVATVVANEWKDGNDKVMPVKQWLEERKFLQGEMQQLKDKLAVAERTAKAEAQLKEKYLLRFKVIDEQIKGSLGSSLSASDGKSRRQSLGGAELSRIMSTSFNSRKAPILRSKNASTLIKHAKVSSKSLDDGIRSYEENDKLMAIGNHVNPANSRIPISNLVTGSVTETDSSLVHNEKNKSDTEDYVSGALYDLLQKEVVILNKFCQEKDKSLKNKEEDIEMLEKKVDTLNKAMEVEARKSRREIAILKEEVATMRGNKEHELRSCSFSAPRGALPRSFSLSARHIQNS